MTTDYEPMFATVDGIGPYCPACLDAKADAAGGFDDYGRCMALGVIEAVDPDGRCCAACNRTAYEAGYAAAAAHLPLIAPEWRHVPLADWRARFAVTGADYDRGMVDGFTPRPDPDPAPVAASDDDIIRAACSPQGEPSPAPDPFAGIEFANVEVGAGYAHSDRAILAAPESQPVDDAPCIPHRGRTVSANDLRHEIARLDELIESDPVGRIIRVRARDQARAALVAARPIAGGDHADAMPTDGPETPQDAPEVAALAYRVTYTSYHVTSASSRARLPKPDHQTFVLDVPPSYADLETALGPMVAEPVASTTHGEMQFWRADGPDNIKGWLTCVTISAEAAPPSVVLYAAAARYEGTGHLDHAKRLRDRAERLTESAPAVEVTRAGLQTLLPGCGPAPIPTKDGTGRQGRLF